jgi:hypothetical protein
LCVEQASRRSTLLTKKFEGISDAATGIFEKHPVDGENPAVRVGGVFVEA